MSDFEYMITRDAAIARIGCKRPDEGSALTRAMIVPLSAT